MKPDVKNFTLNREIEDSDGKDQFYLKKVKVENDL